MTGSSSAADYLAGVFAVIVAKAHEDEAFARALVEAMGQEVRIEPAAPPRPAKSPPEPPAIDLPALYRDLGRGGMEDALMRHTAAELRAIVEAEGFPKLPSRAPKADIAYEIVRQVGRGLGETEIQSA